MKNIMKKKPKMTLSQLVKKHVVIAQEGKTVVLYINTHLFNSKGSLVYSLLTFQIL